MADNSEIQRYTIDMLKTIGESCASKLPPASTVQAMVLYELQRACETESLFKNAFFKIGKQDEMTTALEARVKALENQNHELQCELKETDKNMQEAMERISKQDEIISDLKTANEAMSAKLESHEKAIVAVADETKAENNSELTGMKQQLTELKAALDVAITKAAGLQLRIDKQDKELEKQLDIIRCLTVQKNGAEGTQLVHRVEINSIHGRPMELLIPKGNAMPMLRENRKPAEPVAMTRPLPDVKLKDENLSNSMHAPNGTDLRR